MKNCSVKDNLVRGRFHVGGRLAALGVALGVAMFGASAMADAKWTYDSSAKTLTGIPAAGSMGSSIGGTNSVSFHFQGDMFAGTSSMFSNTTTAKSSYRYRFYIGADGCKKWQEFMENTDYVTPLDDLDASVQAEYRKRFKGRAFGLTTAAAALSDGTGLPGAVWVLSLKKSGFVMIVR